MFVLVLRPIQAILSLGLLILLVEASRPSSDGDVFRELVHAQSAGALEHGNPSEAEKEAEKLAAAAIDAAEKKAESEHKIDDAHEKEKEKEKQAEAQSASPTEASTVEAGPTTGSTGDASSEDASVGSPSGEESLANTSSTEASPDNASPLAGSPESTSPAEASSVNTSQSEVGSPAGASPEEASVAKTSPAEASPDHASPLAGSPESTSPAEASLNTSPSEESPASSRSEIASQTEGSSADATTAVEHNGSPEAAPTNADQSPAVQSPEPPPEAAPSGSDQSPSVESHQPTAAVDSAAATSGDRKEFNHFHALGTQADELHLRVATVTTGEGGGLAKKASGRAANAYKVIGAYQNSLEKLKLGLQANLRKRMEDLAQNMVKDLKHQDDAWKSTLGFEVPQDLKAAEAWDGLAGAGHASSAPAELSDPPAEVASDPPAPAEVAEKQASPEEQTALKDWKELQKDGAAEASQEEKAATVEAPHEDKAALQEWKHEDDAMEAEASQKEKVAAVEAAAPAPPDDEVAAVEKAIQEKLAALEDLCKDVALSADECRKKKDVILAEKDEQLAALHKETGTPQAHAAEDVQKKQRELSKLCDGKARVMNDEDCDRAEAKLETEMSSRDLPAT